MKLKEHEAHLPSKLTVISGQVIYRESTREVKLNIFDEVEIAVKIKHSVEAIADRI